MSIEALIDQIQDQYAVNYLEFEPVYHSLIQKFGNDQMDSTLEDAEIAEEDILLIDVDLKNNQSFSIAEVQPELKYCNFCNRLLQQFILCKSCHKARYCDNSCMMQNSSNHAKKCQGAKTKPQNNGVYIKLAQRNDSKNGLCGLQNLGNTCFMNSGLQCLSNTKKLKKYFISGDFEQDINIKNKLGAQGTIAYAFAELLQKM